MEIDGKNYTLLLDYDRGQYHYLSFRGKVTYMRGRVNLILIRPCEEAMKTALQTDLGLILATAICAGISAAGTFLKGERAPRRKDKEYFLDFVRDYMNLMLQGQCSAGASWAEWLYERVRCGLAHIFAIEVGGIEYELSNYVLEKPYGPEINPNLLLADFSDGWSKYLNAVVQDGQGKGLGTLFEKRFDEVFHDSGQGTIAGDYKSV